MINDRIEQYRKEWKKLNEKLTEIKEQNKELTKLNEANDKKKLI